MPPSRGPISRAPRALPQAVVPVLVVIATVAVAVAGLVSVTATPAHAVGDGSIGIRLTEAPTSRADDPRAQVYVVDHVSPGTTFTRHIEVSNDTDRSRTIRVYAGPAAIRHDAWTTAAPGRTSELTGWISASPERLVLGAHHKAVVPVTFAVPKDASEGERYGVVWASTASTDPGNVTMVSRVGIRVYLSVGPGGEPPTRFTLTDLRGARAADGSPRVLATVTNTGGRAVDLEGRLELSDGPGGLSAGPFRMDDGETLAPGDRATVITTLDGALPAGPWTARLRVWSGTAQQRLDGTLTFPEAAGAASAASAAAVPDSAISWWAWAAGVVLLALLLVLLLARRRRRGGGRGRGAVGRGAGGRHAA